MNVGNSLLYMIFYMEFSTTNASECFEVYYHSTLDKFFALPLKIFELVDLSSVVNQICKKEALMSFQTSFLVVVEPQKKTSVRMIYFWKLGPYPTALLGGLITFFSDEATRGFSGAYAVTLTFSVSADLLYI